MSTGIPQGELVAGSTPPFVVHPKDIQQQLAYQSGTPSQVYRQDGVVEVGDSSLSNNAMYVVATLWLCA
jgi:hypothetical protein